MVYAVELHFDEPIARRVLLSHENCTVTVALGASAPFDPYNQREGWYCPFRVEGAGEQPWSSFAGGIDAVQAIILALARIGDYLSSRGDLDLSLEGSKYLGFLSAKLLSGWTMG